MVAYWHWPRGQETGLSFEAAGFGFIDSGLGFSSMHRDDARYWQYFKHQPMVSAGVAHSARDYGLSN